MNRLCFTISLLLLVTGIFIPDRTFAQAAILIEPFPVSWDPVTETGSFPIAFSSTQPIAGFQFDVVFESPTGLLVDACCGIAETYGYDIGTGSSTVLGFSITLTEIPPTPAGFLLDITIASTNGIPDFGSICLQNPIFADVIGNSIPAAIGPCWPQPGSFRRGDCNSDLVFNLADVIFQLASLFTSGPPGLCQDACDANDDGSENLGDAIYALAALFSGGPAPTVPGPLDCGTDPTTDALDCESSLSCP